LLKQDIAARRRHFLLQLQAAAGMLEYGLQQFEIDATQHFLVIMIKVWRPFFRRQAQGASPGRAGKLYQQCSEQQPHGRRHPKVSTRTVFQMAASL